MEPQPIPHQESVLPFTFSGKGSEYFSIWIVNIALTIITLGIYSAWAKVRKMQYLYRNTSLAGSSFDYHGNPIAILKGRAIAFGAIVGVQLASQFAPAIGGLLMLALFAIMPWMIKRSFQFKLFNSSYRGLRFSFRGATTGAYRVFLLLPMAGILIGGAIAVAAGSLVGAWAGGIAILGGVLLSLMLWPYTHHQIKHYQHDNSRFGATDFSFSAKPGQFYKVYLVAGLLGLATLIVFGIILSGIVMGLIRDGAAGIKNPFTVMLIGFLTMGFFAVYQAIVGPFIQARLQNVAWNNTKLGEHSFVSDVSARKLFFITFTNFILIILTLGLYKPFATIRLLRYRLETMGFVPHGSLETFLAGQAQQQSATGEETAEMFDVDISF
jgi:uncharacterized membrane protein YjgN (DUF898 family)